MPVFSPEREYFLWEYSYYDRSLYYWGSPHQHQWVIPYGAMCLLMAACAHLLDITYDLEVDPDKIGPTASWTKEPKYFVGERNLKENWPSACQGAGRRLRSSEVEFLT